MLNAAQTVGLSLLLRLHCGSPQLSVSNRNLLLMVLSYHIDKPLSSILIKIYPFFYTDIKQIRLDLFPFILYY